MGSIKTSIDRDADLTINIASGRLAIEDLLDAAQGYLAQEPTSKVLWNFLEADGADLSGQDLAALFKAISRLPGTRKKRYVAIVVKGDLGFGLSRQSASFSAMEEIQANHNIFRSVEDAFAWLEQPDGGVGR